MAHDAGRSRARPGPDEVPGRARQSTRRSRAGPRAHILGISTVSTMYTVALAVGTLPQTTLEESLTV